MLGKYWNKFKNLTDIWQDDIRSYAGGATGASFTAGFVLSEAQWGEEIAPYLWLFPLCMSAYALVKKLTLNKADASDNANSSPPPAAFALIDKITGFLIDLGNNFGEFLLAKVYADETLGLKRPEFAIVMGIGLLSATTRVLPRYQEEKENVESATSPPRLDQPMEPNAI